MDPFEPGSQAALKGALVACAKGQWEAESLKVTARAGDGSTLPLELQLDATTFDGEPAVKLCVQRRTAEPQEPEQLVEEAVNKDPVTGFYHRRRFLELLTDRLDASHRAGVRALAYIRPDNFAEIEDEVGPIASEDILDAARRASERACANRTIFAVDSAAPCSRSCSSAARCATSKPGPSNALARIADHIFEVAQNTLIDHVHDRPRRDRARPRTASRS